MKKLILITFLLLSFISHSQIHGFGNLKIGMGVTEIFGEKTAIVNVKKSDLILLRVDKYDIGNNIILYNVRMEFYNGILFRIISDRNEEFIKIIRSQLNVINTENGGSTLMINDSFNVIQGRITNKIMYIENTDMSLTVDY